MQPAPVRRQWWAELRSPSVEAAVNLVCVRVCAHYSQALAYALCLFFYSCTNKNAGAALVHVRAPLSSYFNCSHLIELSPWSVPSFLDVSISQINTRMGPECTAFRLRQQQSAFRNCLLVKCSTLLLFPADSVLSLCLPLWLSRVMLR